MLDIGSHTQVHAAVASAEGDTAIELLRSVLEREGWRAYAPRAGVFIEPDALDLFALPDDAPPTRGFDQKLRSSLPGVTGYRQLPADYSRSSFSRSVLMAKAASAPSAAATTTHCTARDASPATNSPGRCVVSYLPVRTVPLSLNSQPRRISRSER